MSVEIVATSFDMALAEAYNRIVEGPGYSYRVTLRCVEIDGSNPSVFKYVFDYVYI